MDAGFVDAAVFGLAAVFRAGVLRAAGAARFVGFFVWRVAAIEQFSQVVFPRIQNHRSPRSCKSVIKPIRKHDALFGGAAGRVVRLRTPIVVPWRIAVSGAAAVVYSAAIAWGGGERKRARRSAS